LDTKHARLDCVLYDSNISLTEDKGFLGEVMTVTAALTSTALIISKERKHNSGMLLYCVWQCAIIVKVTRSTIQRMSTFPVHRYHQIC
jgi:hypothetical protein